MAEACPKPESSGDLIARLESVVGPKGLVTDPADMEPHLHDRRERYRARARCVVKPASTEETAEVVRICAAQGVPIVPQGGNTGLVAGGIPDEGGRAVVVNLARMNRVRGHPPDNDTTTAEAG